MTWVITGAAGFIGTNLSLELANLGEEVLLIDDLSRIGVKQNADFLHKKFGLSVVKTDVSNWEELKRTLDQVQGIEVVVHLAGQVSFMASINNPRRDFEVNALGTLNILEYVRNFSPLAVVIGMSSNKLYGELNDVKIVETASRYIAPDFPKGFNESQRLDFHGPYGCSKGIADQYLLDYNRIYGLKTLSFRQSSVYGDFQKPAADQGWLAFFLEEARAGRSIQLNGKGKQVRDVLFAQDLVKLFIAASSMPKENFGYGVNVGGGVENSLSILELFEIFENQLGKKITYSFGQERPSDQKVFISDNSLISRLSGWNPETNFIDGIAQLIR
jgi:CDP-paratose 2-epimerase